MEPTPANAGRLLASLRKEKTRKCPVCATEFKTIGRGTHCSHKCRQAAYRKRKTQEDNPKT